MEAKEVSKMNPLETSAEIPAANGVAEPSGVESLEESSKFPHGRRLQFDEHGHAIPPTPAEHAADTAAFLAALEEMAKIPDDPAESDEEFWRAMDEAHPDRPMFKELYGK
jgi:hypothetical protein